MHLLCGQPSESLGFSPYEMIYGHVRGPLDMLKEQWEGQFNVNLLDHIVKFKEKLKNVLKWAQENLKVSQERMKWDPFKIGDSVLVLLPIPGHLKLSSLVQDWLRVKSMTSL